MIPPLVLLLALASGLDRVSGAATITVPIVGLGAPWSGDLAASIVDVESETVVFVLDCQTGIQNCTRPYSNTFSFGPSTMVNTVHVLNSDSDVHVTGVCILDSPPGSMDCMNTQSGIFKTFSIETTVSTTVVVSSFLREVPVTAGADLLPTGWTGYPNRLSDGGEEDDKSEDAPGTTATTGSDNVAHRTGYQQALVTGFAIAGGAMLL